MTMSWPPPPPPKARPSGVIFAVVICCSVLALILGFWATHKDEAPSPPATTLSTAAPLSDTTLDDVIAAAVWADTSPADRRTICQAVDQYPLLAEAAYKQDYDDPDEAEAAWQALVRLTLAEC